MSFIVSGSTWTPKSASEHAQSMLEAMNVKLKPLGKELVPSMVNVVWWICLGLGALAAAFDTVLSSAKDSFNVSTCDDAQLQNLLPVAGVERLPGSCSVMTVRFYGDATGQTVPAGTHIKVLNNDAQFILSSAVVVPANGYAEGQAVCDRIGEIYVLSNQATSTVENLPHIASLTNPDSAVAGSDEESLAQVRKRILTGKTVMSNVDGLALALRALPGIQYANVYFNPSANSILYLPGGIAVQARMMYIVVKGSSPLIGETVFKHTLACTQGPQMQSVLTKSGFHWVVSYNLAGETAVRIQVYVDQNKPYASGYGSEIKKRLLVLSKMVTIGQAVTQELVASVLDDFPYATINGVSVSLDGTTWGRVAVVPGNNIATFSDTNMTVTLE